MSLADELNAIPITSGCATCDWYRKQDPKAQDAFRVRVEHIGNRLSRMSDLHKVCTSHGLAISARSFRECCTNHGVQRDAR